MKNILLKTLLFLPLMVFIDYLIMMIIGCATCLFDFETGFYNCTYCIIGKSLLAITLVIYVMIIYTDLKSLFKK